jgi:hypothetical protein
MTTKRLSVELHGALARVWNLGEAATLPIGSSELALMEMGRAAYLMVGDFWGRRFYSDEEFLAKDVEGASWELIATLEVFQEAIPELIPGPNSHPFAKYFEGRPAYWKSANPSLYEISGVEFQDLKRRLLTKIDTSLTILSLDEDANVISGPREYGAWSIKSRREFFEVRGIRSGDYYCTNVNDEAINVLSAIDVRADESAWIGTGDSSRDDNPLANELVYRVELDAFVFEIFLKAKSSNDENEFLAVRNLLNFFFGSAHLFDECQQRMVEFLSKTLDFDSVLLSEWFEVGEDAYMFQGDMSRSLPGKQANWVRPDYITIQIQTSEFDPSFGTLVNGPVVTYTESFKNWEKTDFNRAAIEPYLTRLRRQAAQLSTKPKL